MQENSQAVLYKEQALGKDPDFRLAGLSLWIHGQEFPNAKSRQDAEWLIVSVRYEASLSEAWTFGPILEISSLAGLLKDMEGMYGNFNGSLDCASTGPGFYISGRMHKTGSIDLTVEIRSPDNISEGHVFKENIDQSYLPQAMQELRAVLAAFPLPG